MPTTFPVMYAGRNAMAIPPKDTPRNVANIHATPASSSSKSWQKRTRCLFRHQQTTARAIAVARLMSHENLLLN